MPLPLLPCACPNVVAHVAPHVHCRPRLAMHLSAVAKRYLQKEAMEKQQVTKLAAMSLRVEATQAAIDSMSSNVEHIQFMKTATAGLKTMQQNFTPEVVDEIRDQYEEVMGDHREIEETMMESWGDALPGPEIDLDAELAALDDEISTSEMTAVAGAGVAAEAAAVTTSAVLMPDLPSVPADAVVLPARAVPAAPMSATDKELADLAF